MALDPSIALQGRPPQFQDPTELAQRAMVIRHLGLQAQQQQQVLDQAQQEQAQQRTLADLYRTSAGPNGQVDPNAIMSGMAQQGLGARIPAYQKSQADLAEKQAAAGHLGAQTGEINWKVEKQKLDATGAALATLASNSNVSHQDVIQTLISLQQNGVITREKGAQIARELPPEDGTDRLRRYLVDQGMQVQSAKDVVERNTKKIEYRNTGQQDVPVDMNSVTNPNPQPLQRQAEPGQVLTSQAAAATNQLGRDRLAFDTAQGQNSFVPVDGVGLFVGDKRTGLVRQVKDEAGNAVKPVKTLTLEQSNALTYGSRMQESNKIIADLSGRGVTAPSMAQQLTGGEGISGGLATAAASPEQQQVDQAQRNFLTAVLRRESGASISPSEFATGRKLYFVQPGDSPPLIAQKTQNRDMAVKGMLLGAPADQRDKLSQPAPTAQPPAPGARPPLEAFQR